jgi:hypothetical protein
MKKLLLSTIMGSVLLAACNSEQDISNEKNEKADDITIEQSTSPTETTVNQNTKIISHHADFIIYEELAELEKSADLIVLAKFTGQRELNEYKTEEGHTFLKNSISTVKILKSFKGDIDVDSTIQTFEPGFFQKENEYVTVEGYNLMNEDGEYILFLKKNLEGPVHTIVGMYQGKYDVSKSNQVNARVNQTDIKSEYLGENVEHFNKLKQEVLTKYH